MTLLLLMMPSNHCTITWTFTCQYATQYYMIIYLFHPRYLHNDIFRYMTCEITHHIWLFMLLFHVVLSKLSTLVVIATSQTCPFSRFLQPPFSGVATQPRVRVRAAAKISAGSVGSPYNQLCCCELSFL